MKQFFKFFYENGTNWGVNVILKIVFPLSPMYCCPSLLWMVIYGFVDFHFKDVLNSTIESKYKRLVFLVSMHVLKHTSYLVVWMYDLVSNLYSVDDLIPDNFKCWKRLL